MDRVFLTILNMSLTGAFVIAAVCLARLSLKKAPRVISYCLWAAAGFRLLVPFSIQSAFSLIPFQPEPVRSAIVGSSYGYGEFATAPEDKTGFDVATRDGASPAAVIILVGSYVWPAGAVVMITRSVVSYMLLKRKLRPAVNIVANVYEADNIKTPFVIGVFSPNIYIPAGLDTHERKYIILHEETHIRRRDNIVKLAAYFVLCLHWFNPLVWAAFLMLDVDMEMCCDEHVLSRLGAETKKDYSTSLLRLATQRRLISGIPIAFGESGVRTRVKNILSFRKRSRAVVIAGVILASIFSAGFSLDQITPAADQESFKSSGNRPASSVFRPGDADGDPGQNADEDDWWARLYSHEDPPPEPKVWEITGDWETETAEQSSNDVTRGYIRLSGGEIRGVSFGRLLNSKTLPYGRYYRYMEQRGDELIVAYTILQ